jgi:hypothetical protein
MSDMVRVKRELFEANRDLTAICKTVGNTL